jgi:hypothetical protein
MLWFLTIGTRSPVHNGTFLLLIEMGGDQMMAQNARAVDGQRT